MDLCDWHTDDGKDSRNFIHAIALAFAAFCIVGTASAIAGEADVLKATATKAGSTWTFTATIKHADEGWKHYANKFEVVAPDGKVLATRTLFHPHVDEQPFTRSVSGVRVPDGTKWVEIRAGDSVHELGGKKVRIELK